MLCKDPRELRNRLKGIILDKDTVAVRDAAALKQDADLLVKNIILSDDKNMKSFCCWIIWEAARNLGILPSSIHDFYQARGRGEFKGLTVPAMNIRTFAYESSSAIFRVARKYRAASFIFEIAKSEIGYTGQRPSEYASVILAAGIKEGYRGPVFIQGDHFQVKAKDYLKNPQGEISKLKDLIAESIAAGFYNIDIDSSTLVNLDKPTLLEQQRLNFEVCSLFTKFMREKQPKGVQISVGGEIGEVGGKNSTPEELVAFMQGYLKDIGNLKGISKMSVQTGTSHGGVVLPDGSLAKVDIDFDTLKIISEAARSKFGLAGAVQHGASTLPPEAFHKFPEVECAEVHLATQFQNIVYDYLPLTLKEKIYAWLHKECAAEKKSDWTDDQFIYKTRKNALGPFKKEIFSLSKDTKNNITAKLEEEFDFLFQQLKIENSDKLIAKYVKPVPVKKKKEDFMGLKDLGVLEGAD